MERIGIYMEILFYLHPTSGKSIRRVSTKPNCSAVGSRVDEYNENSGTF